ncbi:MAG: hypothetical protein AAGJ83_01025 [Planctomycetota bacterium]
MEYTVGENSRLRHFSELDEDCGGQRRFAAVQQPLANTATIRVVVVAFVGGSF